MTKVQIKKQNCDCVTGREKTNEISNKNDNRSPKMGKKSIDFEIKIK